MSMPGIPGRVHCVLILIDQPQKLDCPSNHPNRRCFDSFNGGNPESTPAVIWRVDRYYEPR
jgi:hypothetical protein